MQFSANFEEADNEYFYDLTHWFLHRLTCPDVLYPTVKTTGLYHFPFKSYQNSAQATYFLKWIIDLMALFQYRLFEGEKGNIII